MEGGMEASPKPVMPFASIPTSTHGVVVRDPDARVNRWRRVNGYD
jgi:hypothetical protein